MKPALTGDVDGIKVLGVVGTLFLLFVRTLLSEVESEVSYWPYMEVPMKKTVLIIGNMIKSILSFIFSLGTNILASACLQT